MYSAHQIIEKFEYFVCIGLSNSKVWSQIFWNPPMASWIEGGRGGEGRGGEEGGEGAEMIAEKQTNNSNNNNNLIRV